MSIASDQAMRAVLAQLEMCSSGTTMSFNPAGGPSNDDTDGSPRTGDKYPPHVFWAQQYGPPFAEETGLNRGRSEIECYEVIERAQDELEGLRRFVAPVVAEETLIEFQKRIVQEGEGFEVNVVAQAMRCGPRDVVKAREAEGREPTRGYEPQAVLDTKREARRLRDEEHLTVRQIATCIGVPKSTVGDYLKAAA